MSDDGSFVLISAERYRQMDAEFLCERLSQSFLDALQTMSADELLVLELIANGVKYSDRVSQDPARCLNAARRIATRPDGPRPRPRKDGRDDREGS